MNNFLNELNPSQLQAVKQIDGAILILAGAGSGKTKTITSRLAYLIGEVGIPPQNTLTLTFTNKAAREMRERALKLLGNNSFGPLLATFHKFGLLFLKRYIHLINRENNFLIIDSDDKKKIIKDITSNLDKNLKKVLDEYEFTASKISNRISDFKNAMLFPIDIKELTFEEDIVLLKVYEIYEKYLIDNNLVDFDDLLFLPYKILSDFEDIAREVSSRYQYIMVDEYQDTNELQNELLKKLCFSHNNLCVVGDDDQSIYSFRGAKVENILNFEKIFDDVKVIKLEQNYRSTKEILNVANKLISHNEYRHQKSLFTDKSHKEPSTIFFSDENLEASAIAKKIKELILKGTSPKEITVLFRVSALSRAIEEVLLKERVNYDVIGGVRFYEREEIKDIISYFNTFTNPKDDFSFKRIINKPRRKIGKVTLTKLEEAKGDISIFNFIDKCEEKELSNLIGKKASSTLKELIDNLKELAKIESRITLISEFEKRIKLKDFYSDNDDKVRNIDEFYGMFKDRDEDIISFLNSISLESNEDLSMGESVSLMSIHASKGLEFEHVFIIGLEEGFFPIVSDDVDIEEERRICYVAITRAKSELFLSAVNSRFFRGQRTFLQKSRFFKEANLIKGEFTPTTKVNLNSDSGSKFKKGDLVKHKIFGMGKVIAVSKVGKDLKLTINFGGDNRDIVSSFVERIV